jgi:serine/threonine protein kinase/Ca2+-binding EF-hand superfamily protein
MAHNSKCDDIFDADAWDARYECVITNGKHKFLGEGNFGKVVLGREKRNPRRAVALKFINTLKSGGNMERLYEEVRLQRKLTELSYKPSLVTSAVPIPPNGGRVIRLFSAHKLVDRESGSTTIVLAVELAGPTLLDLIHKRHKFSEDCARRAVFQIATALAGMHANGVVHRDLKLENILSTIDSQEGNEAVLLCDFGLSFEVGRDTRWGEIGTLRYIPPECIKRCLGPACADPATMGDFHVDDCQRCHQLESFDNHLGHAHVPYSDKTDVWALGGIIFNFLAGYSPFEAGCGEEAEKPILRKRIYHHDVQWPPYFSDSANVWDGISTNAKDLISSMLTADAARRPSMAAVLTHPWFTSPAPAVPLDRSVIESLARISAAVKWKRARRKFKAALALSRGIRLATHNKLRGILSGISAIDLASLARAFHKASRPASDSPYTGSPNEEKMQVMLHGSITIAGLKEVLIEAGLEAAHVDKLLTTHHLFEALDADKSGRIDYREFIVMMPLLAGTPLSIASLPDETLRLYVSLWDTNGDGRLQREELSVMLCALHISEGEGDETPEHVLTEILKAADDDVLDWRKLKELFCMSAALRLTTVSADSLPPLMA